MLVRAPLRLGLVAALAALAACAETPTIQFLADDAGGPAADAAPVIVADATPSAPSSLDDDGDDAGPDAAADAAPLGCGTATVKACNACPGKPLRCTDNGRNDCVADCADCAAGTYPCMHCNTNGVARGLCVAPNANGKLQCSNGNRCPCTTAGECLQVAGAAMTCTGGACLTCGEPGTNQAACVDGAGAAGKCAVNGGSPVCK